MANKTYRGIRNPELGECQVTVQNHETSATYALPDATSIRNHSPTGFEWGYGGSGPAQLALAILADHFGPADEPKECPYCSGGVEGWKCVADGEAAGCGWDGEKDGDKWRHIQAPPAHYQQFKLDVVCKLPNVAWELTSAQVQAWAEEVARESAKPDAAPRKEAV